MSAVDRPLRRDAQRNRERLLEAARELFAQRGLTVTLDDIADRAGVGVGTAYRRFNSREELIVALFEERMREIVTLAEQAFTAEDPWEALVDFLTRMNELQAHDRGLKEVLLGSAAGRERVARIRDELRPRAQTLIERAQAAGAVRPDIDASDLPLLQMMIGAVADVAPPERPELWRRFLALLLDGIRAPGCARTGLPEPPLGFDALEDVMCRWRPPASGPEPRRRRGDGL